MVVASHGFTKVIIRLTCEWRVSWTMLPKPVNEFNALDGDIRQVTKSRWYCTTVRVCLGTSLVAKVQARKHFCIRRRFGLTTSKRIGCHRKSLCQHTLTRVRFITPTLDDALLALEWRMRDCVVNSVDMAARAKVWE